MSRRKAKKGTDEVKLAVDLVVIQCDMPTEMEKDVSMIIGTAFADSANNKFEKDIAKGCKLGLDNKYPKTAWHCIVGSHFAACHTASTHHTLFATVNKDTKVLVFKTLD